MARRRSAVSQTDVARVLRAVRETGGALVEVRADGTIRIDPGARLAPPRPDLDEVADVVL